MTTTRRPVPLILAHRGFHRQLRENTRRAILAARDIGAHGVEFDVRTTADEVHVLHHNRTRLIRGRQRPIALLPHGSLPAWIPTLASVLRRMGGWHDFVVDVELKENRLHPDIAPSLKLIPKERLIVTSFHVSTLRDVRTALKGVPLGLLLERPSPRDASRAKRAGCKIMIVHRRALRAPIAAAAKRQRIQLWAWGINSVKRARQAVALGVKGIITDRPDLLLAADLTRRAPPRTSPRKGRRGS